MHRDLSMENLLFSSANQGSDLKMCGFGLSKFFRDGKVYREVVGTPYTVAPEVLLGSYNEKCDIWAVGVIAFLLFSGEPPFGGCGGPETLQMVRANILEAKFSFEPEEIWDLVTDRGKNFVKSMLEKDPKHRPTAVQAQKHSWLQEWTSLQPTKVDADLKPKVVQALVSFSGYSHFRRIFSYVLSFAMLPAQVVDLRSEFAKIDDDASGEITLEGLKQYMLPHDGAQSFGALTNDKVEDIFNKMVINKTEARIPWHGFIAACLSLCQVDDRNLRVAFGRLDRSHKQYVTLDDVFRLVGTDKLHNEEQVQSMWRATFNSVNCTHEHITYDQFLLVMRGQTTEPAPSEVKARRGG